jgi:hypothetical protein
MLLSLFIGIPLPIAVMNFCSVPSGPLPFIAFSIASVWTGLPVAACSTTPPMPTPSFSLAGVCPNRSSHASVCPDVMYP